MKRNILDRFISYVSPGYALKRERARVAQVLYQDHVRKFEAASTSRRNRNWVTTSGSATTENEQSQGILRDRARDLESNNAHINKAVHIFSGYLVGSTGITAQIAGKNDRATTDLRALWEEWIESLDFDFDGDLTFYGAQDLLSKRVYIDGDIIIRRRWRKLSENLVLPLQIQILEGDHLDISYNQILANGNEIRNGIEFDKNGKKIAYHLFSIHPGDVNADGKRVRVPAEDIIYLFDKKRAGQIRGITEIHASMIKVKDHEDLSDAKLLKHKLQNCFTGFIQDIEPDSDAAPGKEFDEDLEPGTLKTLPNGKTITFASPPQADGDQSFNKETLKSISAGVKIPYELMTGDLSDVNYSSLRAGFIPFYVFIDGYRKKVFQPKVCGGIFKWFLEAAEMVGKDTQSAKAKWIPPKREMLDVVKETSAAIRSIRGGISTLSEVVSQNGKSPEEHFKALQKDMNTMDELGLVLETDVRKMMKTTANERNQ